MTAKVTLLNFLKLNAFFIKVRNFYAPYADPSAVCFIPPSLESEIGFRANMDELTVNKGVTREGQVYYTTPYGLVLLIDTVFPDGMVSGTAYMVNDYWLIYPEATMSMIWNGSLRLKESVYAKDARELKKADIDAALKRRAENEESALAASKRFEADKVRFFAFITEGGGSELLAERLWGFDIFYTYSDDSKVYNAGSEKEKVLLAELAKHNINGKIVMTMLVSMKSVQN